MPSRIRQHGVASQLHSVCWFCRSRGLLASPKSNNSHRRGLASTHVRPSKRLSQHEKHSLVWSLQADSVIPAAPKSESPLFSYVPGRASGTVRRVQSLKRQTLNDGVAGEFSIRSNLVGKNASDTWRARPLATEQETAELRELSQDNALSQTLQIESVEQRPSQRKTKDTHPSEPLSILYDGDSPGTRQAAAPVDLANTTAKEVIRDLDNTDTSPKEPTRTIGLGNLPSEENNAKISQSPTPTPWLAEIDGWKKKASPNSWNNPPNRMPSREPGSRQISPKSIFASPKASYSSMSTSKVGREPDHYGGLYHPSQPGDVPDIKIPTVASKYTKTPPLDQKTSRTTSINPKTFEGRSLPVPQHTPPSIQHGLDRVLFNPGVFHLRDPRSRVYNFAPYLEKVLPMSDFDFGALKDYKKSSEDISLGKLAKKHQLKYITSTSNLTGILQHFHFLLSRFRELNHTMLSKGFDASIQDLTPIQYLPEAVFLRYRKGTYAIDKDNHTSNFPLLSYVGRVLEKLLTVSKAKFDQYHKSSPNPLPEDERGQDDSYHYTSHGKILTRSQLDARDHRLPGTGVFDLKTRAVVPIRMDYRSRLDVTRGYEIKQNLGEYESYEREFYDMTRTVMLKYSLQVRLGRMDGIFVAYHNIERMFGFQYLSLSEMDHCLHGQADLSLGRQELNVSMALLEKALDQITQKYSNQSVWLHVDVVGRKQPTMYIFAQPMAEDQIETLNEDYKAREKETEMLLLSSERVEEIMDETPNDDEPTPSANILDNLQGLQTSADILSSEAKFLQKMLRNADPSSIREDKAMLKSLGPFIQRFLRLNEELERVIGAIEDEKLGNEVVDLHIKNIKDVVAGENSILAGFPLDLLADVAKSLKGGEYQDSRKAGFFATHSPSELTVFKLEIENKVDGEVVDRPTDLTQSSQWIVDYTLTEVTDGAEALAKYYAMKKKYLSRVQEEKQTEGFYNGMFMKNLVDLSKRGKQWRAKQDLLDSQKETVVWNSGNINSASPNQ